MDKIDEEEHYRLAVMRAHNITFVKKGERLYFKKNFEPKDIYYCNDGDGFYSLWKALDHTIWLDLLSKRVSCLDRDCNDYYELINERPSHQSLEEDKKVKQ
jgi:hypothetical protein